jgi:hypothetical protein
MSSAARLTAARSPFQDVRAMAPTGERSIVRPVLIEGHDATSTARPVILDAAPMRPGGPIWVEVTPNFWKQGIITRVMHSEVHLKLVG